MKLLIPNKLYDVLKYLCTIGLYAVATFIGVVFPAVGISEGTTNLVVTIISATATLIGTLIGVSSYNYKKTQEENAKIFVAGYEDGIDISNFQYENGDKIEDENESK